MLLAHGGGGGSAFEALILALPLIAIGVVLFVQKTATPVVSIAMVAAGIAIAVGSMTIFAEDDHDAEASHSGDGSGYVSLVTGLCEARSLAGSDVEAAATAFENEAHVPLHDLAAEVGDADRDAAASLLEAKETVESDLAEGLVEGEVLKDHMGGLLDATVTALRAIDVEAPTC